MTPVANHILLTGGAGFIGSHTAEALLARGFRLTIVDDLNDFYPPGWKKANLEDIRRTGDFDFSSADIRDLEQLRGIFAKSRPNVVLHLAARAGVRPSIEQPRLYEQVNLAGTLNLLELCREFSVPRFVFGSSSSVYGASSPAPFSEDLVGLRPISPYAATKLAGEMLCHTYAHLFRIATLCLRFFTVYGPRQRPDLVIHKFVALIEGGKPIPVFGDGSSGRDYTYITDIVAGILAALDYRFPEGLVPFEVFNLGNSNPVKLNELIRAIEQATGKKAVRDVRPPQPGDVPLTWADLSKSETLLGFRPVTSLADGLAKFVAWYRATPPSRRA